MALVLNSDIFVNQRFMFLRPIGVPVSAFCPLPLTHTRTPAPAWRKKVSYS